MQFTMFAKSALCVFGFLTILVGSIQGGDEPAARIGGGQDAAPHEYPFVASIRRFGTHYCGCSIVNEHYLVTVAHCLYNQTLETIDVVTGTNTWNKGGTIHKIAEIIVHELFRYEADVIADNDIGLLRVKDPITLDESAQKLRFPNRSVTPNSVGILVGWGRTSQAAPAPESNLQTLQTTTIDDNRCNRLNPNRPRRTLTFSNFCTSNRKGTGGCYGDSGTPLVEPSTHAIMGLYSWVVPSCATKYPDGYTKFWEYIDWVKTHTDHCKDENDNKPPSSDVFKS